MRWWIVCWLLLLPNQAWSQSVDRIISLAPNLTELVFSAGLGDKLIATDWSSNYPASVRDLPKVGDVNSLSYEQILALQPGLVLAWKDGISAKAVEKLTSLGIRVKVFELQKLDDIPLVIKWLSQFQTSKQPGLVAENLAYILRSERRKSFELINRQPVQTFFYQIWDKPLITVNNQQFTSQVLEICGLRNVIDGERLLASEINQEQVIQFNPDWIFLSANQQVGERWLKNWQKFTDLTAVKQQQVIILSTELGLSNDVLHRPAERLIRAIPTICEKLRK